MASSAIVKLDLTKFAFYANRYPVDAYIEVMNERILAPQSQVAEDMEEEMGCGTRIPILALVVATLVPGGIPIVAVQERDLSHQLTVTEVWDYAGSTELGGFSYIDGLGEAKNGTIWVSDASPGWGRVFLYNPLTDEATVVGRPGEGPGEVLSTTIIAIDPDGNIAMYDIVRSSIELYSPTGEPVRRIRLPHRVTWVKGFDVLPSGDFVISGGVVGVNSAIHQFSREGRFLRSWGESAQADDWEARIVGTGGALHALPDGSLLYSQGAPHRIAHYLPTDEGWSEYQIAAFPDLIDAPRDAVIVEGVEDGVPYRTFHVTYPQSRGVFQIGEGLILNVVVAADDGQSIWQLFDPDRTTTDGHSTLIAETRTQAYEPWFKSLNGDILGVRKNLDTGVPTVVRLHMAWTESDAR